MFIFTVCGGKMRNPKATHIKLMNIAVIFAGGVGKRMNNTALPKQFMKVNGVPIIIHTLLIFQQHLQIDKIYISVIAEFKNMLEDLIRRYQISKVAAITEGGESGLDSIYNGLKLAASENADDTVVLIHDGVRPIVTDAVITRNIEAVRLFGSAITCVPSTETIILSHDAQMVEEIPPREFLHKAQAPQSFYLGKILSAHDQLRTSPERYGNLVDSCSVYQKVFGEVHLVHGNYGNIKITTPEDVFILQGLLRYKDASSAFGIE